MSFCATELASLGEPTELAIANPAEEGVPLGVGEHQHRARVLAVAHHHATVVSGDDGHLHAVTVLEAEGTSDPVRLTVRDAWLQVGWHGITRNLRCGHRRGTPATPPG